MRQQAIKPAREPPVAFTEQLHGGRDEEEPDDQFDSIAETTSFNEYAAKVGATELPDLLEAAALRQEPAIQEKLAAWQASLDTADPLAAAASPVAPSA